jgi:hypothetical protein
LKQRHYAAAVFSSERMNQVVMYTIRYGTIGPKGFNATSALSQRSDRLGFGKTNSNFLY